MSIAVGAFRPNYFGIQSLDGKNKVEKFTKWKKDLKIFAFNWLILIYFTSTHIKVKI